MKLKQLLSDDGIAALDLGYDTTCINEWNAKLESQFAKAAAENRSYVNAQGLMQSGVLDSIFGLPMREAICGLFDNPVIYHCHAYEIAADSKVSHIHAGPLCGWHGDDECVPHYKNGTAEFISLFVYLTDVESTDDGAFELRPISPSVPLAHGQETVAVLGSKGTTFAFNRSFAHRAQPNIGNKRRRVFKMSIQERYLPHERRDVVEFDQVSATLTGTDNFLSELFDTSANNPMRKLVTPKDASSLAASALIPNSRITLGVTGRIKTAIGGGRIAA